MKTEQYRKKRESKLARLAYMAAIIASLSVVWVLIIRPALPAVAHLIAVTRQPDTAPVTLPIITDSTAAPVIATIQPPAIAPATAVPVPPVNVAPADTTGRAAAVYNENPALAEDCMAAAVAGRRMSPQCRDVIQRMGQGR
jgi:hypothetical protein